MDKRLHQISAALAKVERALIALPGEAAGGRHTEAVGDFVHDGTEDSVVAVALALKALADGPVDEAKALRLVAKVGSFDAATVFGVLRGIGLVHDAGETVPAPLTDAGFTALAVARGLALRPTLFASKACATPALHAAPAPAQLDAGATDAPALLGDPAAALGTNAAEPAPTPTPPAPAPAVKEPVPSAPPVALPPAAVRPPAASQAAPPALTETPGGAPGAPPMPFPGGGPMMFPPGFNLGGGPGGLGFPVMNPELLNFIQQSTGAMPPPGNGVEVESAMPPPPLSCLFQATTPETLE